LSHNQSLKNIEFKSDNDVVANSPVNPGNAEEYSENSLLNYDLNYTESVKNHTFEKERHPFKDYNDGGIVSQEKKEIYYVGIIDILTEFNTFKKCEYFGKLVYYCSAKMSCVPPDNYQLRFYNYMETKFSNK